MLAALDQVPLVSLNSSHVEVTPSSWRCEVPFTTGNWAQNHSIVRQCMFKLCELGLSWLHLRYLWAMHVERLKLY